MDVTTTRDAGLGGAIDEDNWHSPPRKVESWSTHDSDLIAIHHSGTPHAGIIYGEKDRHTIGQLVRSTAPVLEVSEPAEMIDRLEYL